MINVKKERRGSSKITWRERRTMQSDCSDILPNNLNEKFTSVPSLVPVSSPVLESNLPKESSSDEAGEKLIIARENKRITLGDDAEGKE